MHKLQKTRGKGYICVFGRVINKHEKINGAILRCTSIVTKVKSIAYVVCCKKWMLVKRSKTVSVYEQPSAHFILWKRGLGMSGET